MRINILKAATIAAMATVFSGGLYSAVAQTAPGTPGVAESAQPGEEQPAANENGDDADFGATAEMQAVLDKLVELGAQPLGTVDVETARMQASPADAVMGVMEDEGIEVPAEIAAVTTRDFTIPGPDGEIEARLYTPGDAGEGPLPLVVYFHGGGFVIADIDVYDASPRALAAETGAAVVAFHYRQGPEDRFPAAHEDAWAAYEWAVENSGELNADADRIALAGESAGGNLAINVAIQARDRETIQPVAQVLVYPLVGNDLETPSYVEYENAAPLSKEAIEWFVANAFASEDETADPRVNVVARDDLNDLPPTTVVLAEIDPLHSEGEMLAERLTEQGVDTELMSYDGVSHEFFGMGAVVPEAAEAVSFAAGRLTEAFEAVDDAPTPTPAPAQ